MRSGPFSQLRRLADARRVNRQGHTAVEGGNKPEYGPCFRQEQFKLNDGEEEARVGGYGRGGGNPSPSLRHHHDRRAASQSDPNLTTRQLRPAAGLACSSGACRPSTDLKRPPTNVERSEIFAAAPSLLTMFQ